jgi:hypothetical protein
MAEVLITYKLELVKRQKKVKDLANDLQKPYSTVSRILNGFDIVPAWFDSAVKKIFCEWDSKKKQEQ